jgi:hypothetical protein
MQIIAANQALIFGRLEMKFLVQVSLFGEDMPQ